MTLIFINPNHSLTNTFLFKKKKTDGDDIGKHRTTPKTSPQKFKVDVIGTPGADEEGPEIIQTHGETTDPRIETSFLLNDLYKILVMLFMRT